MASVDISNKSAKLLTGQGMGVQRLQPYKDWFKDMFTQRYNMVVSDSTMTDLDLHQALTSGITPNVCCRYWVLVERVKTNDFVYGGGSYCRSMSRDQLRNHLKFQYDEYEKARFFKPVWFVKIN